MLQTKGIRESKIPYRNFETWRWNPWEFFTLLLGPEPSCAYCGGSDRVGTDHVVPLARGGSDDVWNWAPACRRCNSSKGRSAVAPWVERRGLDPTRYVAWLAQRDHFLVVRGIEPETTAPVLAIRLES